MNCNNSDVTKTTLPLLGDKLPSIEVLTTNGPMKFPEDMSGKWFVLFSHPSDFTPVCTTEFIEFQKQMKDFDNLDCKLVGLSIDQIFSHIKWIEWIKEKMDIEITFPVIAGTETVATKLGMLHPGKSGSATVRAVFIIDPKGILRTMFYYPQEIGRNIDEIVRTVKALQLADKTSVAVPANWPNNSILKDRVIIPPAKTLKDAMERLANPPAGAQCYDWWLCHKPLN